MIQSDYEQHIEVECRDAFGSPETRKRKTERYLRRLVHQHTELLVRQVLDTLSHQSHFIPAEHLRGSRHFYCSPRFASCPI
jgi:hypothetical protein